MKITTVDISREYEIEGSAELKCFLHESGDELKRYNHDLPAIVVVPGGGYSRVSKRSADPIAVRYFTYHYDAFVLRYSVAPEARWPIQLTQLACAVDYIKAHAEEWGIDRRRVFVAGFSAGGHLVGCLANFCDDLPVPIAGGKKLDARPAAVVLGYSVINYDSHIPSFANLTGESGYTPLCEKLSLDARVTPAHPPAFLWTTAEDECVDPMATVRYTAALLGNGVKVETHIFPTGEHGGSTCDDNVLEPERIPPLERAAVWLEMSDKFLRSLDIK